MWKPLNHWDSVSVGDKIRFRGTYPGNPEEAYTVVQTEAHYFQILPAVEKAADEMRRKVVKYFEIGTYLKVEVWANN